MDSDFVNVYISKQKALIDDLQSRLLLCETKLQLTQAAHEKSMQDYEAVKQELEKQEAMRQAQQAGKKETSK